MPPSLHCPISFPGPQPPSHPMPPPPPLPCWAGDRPLNVVPGVPDGSYRWSVVIRPIEPWPGHRLSPAKIQRLGRIILEEKKKNNKGREEEWQRENASQQMTKATLSFTIKAESLTECFYVVTKNNQRVKRIRWSRRRRDPPPPCS